MPLVYDGAGMKQLSCSVQDILQGNYYRLVFHRMKLLKNDSTIPILDTKVERFGGMVDILK